MLKKTFKYRLYPNKAQAEALSGQLSEASRLYNAALQERIEAYARHRKSVSYYDQAAQLTEIRKTGDLGLPNCHCAQDVLKRLDKAFKAFFRRLKQGQKPGFPRFKSRRRYDSITFPSHGDGNKLLPSGHLFVQGVGNAWGILRLNCTARCTARLRPSPFVVRMNTGTCASPSRRQRILYLNRTRLSASTLGCHPSQRSQTVPKWRVHACTNKRRRNFVVRNVVWHAVRRVQIAAARQSYSCVRFTNTSSTSVSTISTNWLACW